jgi:hypothetical protein
LNAILSCSEITDLIKAEFRKRCVEKERIAARTTSEVIGVRSTNQRVISWASIERISSIISLDPIGKRRANESIDTVVANDGECIDSRSGFNINTPCSRCNRINSKSSSYRSCAGIVASSSVRSLTRA